MNKSINWKMFSILLAATMVAVILALPYVLTLATGYGIEITPILIVAQIVQAAVLFGIAIYFGLRIAERVGFGLPFLERTLRGEKSGINGGVLRLPIGLGILTTVLIIIFSIPFGSMSLEFLRAGMAVPAWKAIMVSFYGGIAEEVLLRLFLMTLLVWITFKFKRTPEGKPTAAGIWLAIIFSSVLFGLGHLPITGAITAITPAVVIRAIVLNGIGGVIFGWLYWKKGLEMAMVSHFTADIGLHVITPLVASFFI